ncbi:MAG TPA: citramalate synthase, partial [Acidimicrobiales bacterium]|nr:citramalate synthase [Acidimicrobiales bacterium]
EQLDHLGVTYIEGGWPGANPKDDDFFSRAPRELKLSTAQLVAFGSTRRPNAAVSDDPTLKRLCQVGTQVVCIVAKSSDYHVTETLRTSLKEARAMARESVEFLVANGLKVLLDAEHFFDGYRTNPDFSLALISDAMNAGADTLVLCDTNGGTLPHEVSRIVTEVRLALGENSRIGIHAHNDSGVAAANALAAVAAGATQVQGCINGYGERTGNANLTTLIPDLSLKMGVRTIPEDRMERLTAVSRHIAELVNHTLDPQHPYVGTSAFTHKAGLHTSAIARKRDAYEHISPDSVGNGTRFVVSELSGRSTIALKAQELGLDLDGEALGHALDRLKALEHEGYHFETADGSLELLLLEATGWKQDFFRVESFEVRTELTSAGETGATNRRPGGVQTEAVIKVHVGDERIVEVAEGNGPVNALDAALRKAIGRRYSALSQLHLTDYRVRVVDTSKGTGAVTRVLIDSTNGEEAWSTIGVSENIIEASWYALVDSIVYGLLVQDRKRTKKGTK